jgi:hypothetical protein
MKLSLPIHISWTFFVMAVALNWASEDAAIISV